MDLYRVFVCFRAEDELLAGSAAKSASLDLTCLHFALPAPNAVFCCKARRKFLKLLRCHAGDSVPPRKTRDLKLPNNFWISMIETSKVPAEEETDVWGSEVFSQAGLLLHRLFDYFPPRDLRKQLEIVCCLSNASLHLLDGKLPDNLSSALLRAVEFQESRVFFVLPSASSSLPASWLCDLHACILTVDSDGNCRMTGEEDGGARKAPFWRGGVRFYSEQVRSCIPGLQLIAAEDEEEGQLCAVPLAPARWIDVIRPIDSGDFCPLLPSGRRLSLCLQSSSCAEAAAFLRFLRSTAGLFCRLPLYSASAEFNDTQRAETEDFIPSSERWASQLLSDLRSDEAPCSLPPSSISLSFFLLPSESQSASGLLSCDVMVLRQSWELPIAILRKAKLKEREAVAEEEVTAVDKALEQLFPKEAMEEQQEEEERSFDAFRELACLLRTQVAKQRRSEKRKSGEGLRPELVAVPLQRSDSTRAEGSLALTRKDSDCADHLIEQLLQAFHKDGTPAKAAVEAVKPQHRSIVDNVRDPSKLHWPQAANVFYHGIYYNRGPWCEKRAERLAKLQTASIPQETMCTVTRFGCRGNVSSAKPAGGASLAEREARSKARRESVSQEKRRSSCEQQRSRSQRHEEKLRFVVCDVLAQEGILPSDPRYTALSSNLFTATKTVIKLQKLPNSRNLREKMEEIAKLQFHVIKQLSNG